MTSFASLVTDIYGLTNRPDLVNETAIAIRAATLKAHQREFYSKDLFETLISFPTADFVQQFEYKTLVPLWRASKYLRIFDNTQTPGVATTKFDLITPDSVLDSYGANRQNVYYIAGLEYQILSATAQQYYSIGCYVHPNVVQATYSSWIADEYPFAIIFGACEMLFKIVGFDEQVRAMKDLKEEQYLSIDTSAIVDQGA